VSATVNLATGTARVSHPDTVTPDELIATVERAGYTAELPALATGTTDEDGSSATDDSAGQDREEAGDLERLVVTAVLAVPMMVLSMVPAWQFDRWQQMCFTLATPVAIWGAWPFHQRANSPPSAGCCCSGPVPSGLSWPGRSPSGGRRRRWSWSTPPRTCWAGVICPSCAARCASNWPSGACGWRWAAR